MSIQVIVFKYPPTLHSNKVAIELSLASQMLIKKLYKNLNNCLLRSKLLIKF